MTLKQRAIVIGFVSALLLSGFAFGRISNSASNTSAEENKASTPSQSQDYRANSTATNAGGAFYLQEFKNGYDDGFNAGVTGEVPTRVATDPAGYNDGFKQGYADSYKSQINADNSQTNTANRTVAYRNGQQVVYKPSRVVVQRRGHSKLKTALTIAAPAAIGAGIGALAGGGKGAGIGALLGGGGGAAYYLYKNRHR
jgi:hypothetical protein